MKTISILTKLQYKVIFLYSKGLTFNEISIALTTSSQGVYTYSKRKDLSRVTRAKSSRITNQRNYASQLGIFINRIKKEMEDCSLIERTQAIINIRISNRLNYIGSCLDVSNRSYNRHKLTLLKKKCIKD